MSIQAILRQLLQSGQRLINDASYGGTFCAGLRPAQAAQSIRNNWRCSRMAKRSVMPAM